MYTDMQDGDVMENYEFLLEDIIKDTSPSMSQNVYLKVRDSEGRYIAFWGRPKSVLGLPGNMTNIEEIRSSSLPITVKIECDYCLKAASHLSRSIGVEFSVSEGTRIVVISEGKGV